MFMKNLIMDLVNQSNKFLMIGFLARVRVRRSNGRG